MNYIKTNNTIIISDPQDFNAKQILDCGQIFRYTINESNAVVYSKDKRAIISTDEEKIIISTDEVDYFEHFFDLKTDYSTIKKL